MATHSPPAYTLCPPTQATREAWGQLLLAVVASAPSFCWAYVVLGMYESSECLTMHAVKLDSVFCTNFCIIFMLKFGDNFDATYETSQMTSAEPHASLNMHCVN